jgi:hypothetical protein
MSSSQRKMSNENNHNALGAHSCLWLLVRLSPYPVLLRVISLQKGLVAFPSKGFRVDTKVLFSSSRNTKLITKLKYILLNFAKLLGEILQNTYILVKLFVQKCHKILEYQKASILSSSVPSRGGQSYLKN